MKFDFDITPMMLSIATKPFDDPNYIFELKMDGMRCLAFCTNETTLQNRNKKNMSAVFPELLLVHAQCKKPCVLDGEIVCLGQDGKPNFQVLQKRLFVKSATKAKALAKQIPACFVVFDMLFLGNQNICSLPLLERKKLLEQNVSENGFVLLSRFVQKKGIDFFEQTKRMGLEGMVAKQKNSEYHANTRSKDWIKIKNIQEEDCLICGYTVDEMGNIKHLVLGLNKNGKWQLDDILYLPPGKREQKLVKEFAKKHPAKPYFDMLGVVWMGQGLICTVQFLQKTDKGVRRHPVFKAIRTD